MRGFAQCAGLLTAILAVAPAQSAANPPDPATLRRSSFTWSQDEREFGFAHWDSVFADRLVSRGAHVRDLPNGAPLAALEAGTPGAQALARFIVDEKGRRPDRPARWRRATRALRARSQRRRRWTSQSVAKAITSTLVGVAVKDGYIASLDDGVTKYIPALRGSAYDDVTIRQLMTMTSGVPPASTST